MCGIFGEISSNDVVATVLNGLKLLEYRGYDSVGLAGINNQQNIELQKVVGRVDELSSICQGNGFFSKAVIGHTRWATHGLVSLENTHPHVSNDNNIAVVHNGVIENYEILRTELLAKGFKFSSTTDSEVIVHLIDYYYKKSLDIVTAVAHGIARLQGAYSLAILARDYPEQIICAKLASPLILGILDTQMLFSSDVAALGDKAKQIVYLEDGDLAIITPTSYKIFDKNLHQLKRPIEQITPKALISDLGGFKHYMQKEIFEQPQIISALINGFNQQLDSKHFGDEAETIFSTIKQIQILACGTSYNAGLVAKYWIERIAKIQCSVEIASEYSYRLPVVNPDTLIVTLSQSGETADTITALNYAIKHGAKYTLAMSSVKQSTLMRMSKLKLLINSGLEVGVAATKSFTSQLIYLLYLSYVLAKLHNQLKPDEETILFKQLNLIPQLITNIFSREDKIKFIANKLAFKSNALYLGRDILYPIAIEGALKLKEISYMNVEAYASGELKHGPLALIDNKLPVIATIAGGVLVDKVKSSLQIVLARGGVVFAIVDNLDTLDTDTTKLLSGVIDLGLGNELINPEMLPILYVIPLQLLAYYVAIYKGTDVDKPRNLAKSVTVE